MIDRHIGREKRLEVAAKWRKEAEERMQEELEKLERENGEKGISRRPSRFEVVPSPDVSKLRDLANHEMLHSHKRKDSLNSPSLGLYPRKSILKKTNSFNLRNFAPLLSTSPSATPYSTITASESRLRSAFDVIFRKSATLQDVVPAQPSPDGAVAVDPKQNTSSSQSSESPNTSHIPISHMTTSPVSFSPNVSKKVQLVRPSEDRLAELIPLTMLPA